MPSGLWSVSGHGRKGVFISQGSRVMQRRSAARREGFTLIELSMVIVIIGLLVGGVLGAQSLIRASHLRSIVADYEKFVASAMAFRDKFSAVPGDISDATRYWGYAGGAGCVNRTGTTDTTPGVCDGDGDARLMPPASASAAGEDFQFWRQLALAGMISGSYTGFSGSGSADHSIADVNVPRTRIGSNSGWFVHFWAPHTGVTHFPNGVYANSLQVGFIDATWDPIIPIFTPAEMWSIDVKLDDGRPGRGKVVPRNYSTDPSASPALDGCTTAVNGTDIDADYRTAEDRLLCIGIFRQQFF